MLIRQQFLNKYKYVHYKVVAEGPGVARGKFFFEKTKIFEKKNWGFFLAYVTPGHP